MSETARQRAAARRSRRTQRGNASERAARDSGAAHVIDDQEIGTEESPPDHPPADHHQDPGDSGIGDVSQEPAETSTSGNREELRVSVRRRDRRFLEALAAHQGCSVEQAVEKLIREAHVKMRASSGASMRFSEFQQGDREPESS